MWSNFASGIGTAIFSQAVCFRVKIIDQEKCIRKIIVRGLLDLTTPNNGLSDASEMRNLTNSVSVITREMKNALNVRYGIPGSYKKEQRMN